MMAAHPIAVVQDGKVEIPEEVKNDPRFGNGAHLRLVPVIETADQESSSDVLAKWESLAGILADSDYDPNAELEREKRKELQDEARWLYS